MVNEQRNVIKRIIKNAKNLLELISNILDISKLEAGAMKINATAGAVEEFLVEISETCQPLLSDKPVSLHTKSDVNEPCLVVDWGLLRQIALNLVSNAIKFTIRGRIDIEASYRASERILVITVRDTGIGIEKEKLDQIFQPFRQLENSYTKKYAGTGLGLAISRGQAELLGGKISVKSSPGQGSEFILKVSAVEGFLPKEDIRPESQA